MTALDVARAAGVSQTTVSFVVNATSGQSISQETRQRVLDAVRELGYTPHLTARALRRGRSDVVLLPLPDLSLAPAIGRLIDALSIGMAEYDLSLLVRRPRAGESFDTLWRSMSPAAVVALGGLGETEEDELRAAGIATVAVLLAEPDAPRPSVVVPQHAIGRMQVEHLYQQGYRTICYLAPSEARLSGIADMRVAGALEAHRRLGLGDIEVRHTALDVAEVHPVVDSWFRPGRPPIGIAAYNDEFGAAVLASLHHSGRRAPRDLAVIGIDNDPMSAFTSPPLTTIDQRIDAVGARLAAITAVELGMRTEPLPDPGAVITLIRRGST